MLERFLPPAQVPASLWCNVSHLLRLPRSLSDAYVVEIDHLGLREQARCPPAQDGPVGGITAKQTRDHFAERFTGSCGRIELAVIDPKNELENASDMVVRAFAGGRVSLLDVPCGAGAATASLLTTIAELRKEKRLPKLPLRVRMVGGDISPPAIEIATRLLNSLKPFLEEQAIYLETEWTSWDALDADGTTGVLDSWIANTADYELHFLMLANFSAFLHKQKQFDRANPQLQEMIRWTSRRRSSMVLWVEPSSNNGAQFFQDLGRKFISRLRHMGLWRSQPNLDRPHASTQCKMAHPFESGGQFRTGVHLIVLKKVTP